METGRFIVRDRAQIGTVTFGAGNAGTLKVPAAESVEVIGSTADGLAPSGLFVSTDSDSTGNGGDLTLETPPQLTVFIPAVCLLQLTLAQPAKAAI